MQSWVELRETVSWLDVNGDDDDEGVTDKFEWIGREVITDFRKFIKLK